MKVILKFSLHICMQSRYICKFKKMHYGYKNMFTHTYTNVRTHTRTRTCPHTRTPTYPYTHTRTHARANTHKRTQTRAHIQPPNKKFYAQSNLQKTTNRILEAPNYAVIKVVRVASVYRLRASLEWRLVHAIPPCHRDNFFLPLFKSF